MDCLTEGLIAMAETMAETASTPVLYQLVHDFAYVPGGEGLATLNATLGQTTREQAVEEGLISVVRRLDILVSAAEFDAAFAGLRADPGPHEGDVVELHGRRWEVRPFGGEPGWRYADPHRVRYRVHLVEVPHPDWAEFSIYPSQD